MKKPSKYRIIIGGGGTGGHVFPAIAIANALTSRLKSVNILFVGARGKMEMEKVPEAGYSIIGLPVSGFKRKLSLQNVSFFIKLARSLLKARSIIQGFKPDVAIGVGGYASGPILKSAARHNIPILIQEQNSYAGVTNRMLAQSASTICVAYEGMEEYFPEDRIVLTGNPIRQDLILEAKEKEASRGHFGLDPGKKVILLLGGSLGARTLNNCMYSNLEVLAASGVQVLWQSGTYYYKEAKQKLEESTAKNIVLLPFIKEMNKAYQVADLIISRAGAGTISELCMVAKPIILVPSPNVAEDHQTKNARALVEKNAVILIHDKEAEERLIETAVMQVMDEQGNNKLSENIKKLAIMDSADRIADEVVKLLKN
ncbi:undecaprenyldiphospho-muramoylpentapeptide beta-N-acetylglucosaminyltransferase [Bacteroidota bacterium]